jgi:hypothetical protein
MYCGAMLLLASAMPRESHPLGEREPSASQMARLRAKLN